MIPCKLSVVCHWRILSHCHKGKSIVLGAIVFIQCQGKSAPTMGGTTDGEHVCKKIRPRKNTGTLHSPESHNALGQNIQLAFKLGLPPNPATSQNLPSRLEFAISAQRFQQPWKDRSGQIIAKLITWTFLWVVDRQQITNLILQIYLSVRSVTLRIFLGCGSWWCMLRASHTFCGNCLGQHLHFVSTIAWNFPE